LRADVRIEPPAAALGFSFGALLDDFFSAETPPADRILSNRLALALFVGGSSFVDDTALDGGGGGGGGPDLDIVGAGGGGGGGGGTL
jgi:hypothetical protein